MLNTLALAVDRPALAKLLAVELAALLLVSLAAIGGRFGRAGIFFALACVLCDPLLLWETTVVYADIALALLGLLAAASIVEWDAGRDRSALLRAAILAGLCAGTRYQGVVVAASLAFALVVAGRQPLRSRLAGASALALGVALFVAPWLLRNLVNTGSPFARGAFDPVVVEQLQTYVHKIGMGRGFTSLLLAPWNVTFSPTPDAYVGGFGYQIGPLYLVAAVLAVFTLRRYTLTAFCLCAALAQALVWFHTEQEVRFLLPAFMLVSVAGAEAAGWLASAAPALHRGLVAVQLWAVMLGQVGFWNGSGSAYRMALGDIPLNLVRGETPAELIGDLLRAQGRPDLKVLPLFESRAWHLRGVSSIPYHIIDAAPVLLEVHRALRAGELCAWLEGHRITHVLVNDTAARNAWPTFVDGYGQADYEEDLRQLREFLASSTDLRAAIGGVFLYELRPVPCQRPGP